MNADLEYWIKQLEGDREILQELNYYNLPHKEHSVTELHEMRAAIEAQTIHAELLINALRDVEFESKEPFWKKLFRK